MPFITAIERFANDGGMITEQLWEADDLPDGQMIRGKPTGAAMPLCWSHAEYIELVRELSRWRLFRSRRTGVSALRPATFANSPGNVGVPPSTPLDAERQNSAYCD
jgi:hypothetical protein